MLSNLFKYLPEPTYTTYLPLLFKDERIGWVHQDNLPLLRPFTDIFTEDKNMLHFSDAFINTDFADRSAQIDTFSRHLLDIGFITNWRDEAYGIYLPNEDLQTALFTIERGVAPVLGLRVFGVHINGYLSPNENASIEKMWIAKRSKLKKIEPHKLDNLAAGGLSFGEKPEITAIRESMEEANIPEELTRALAYAGPFNYLAEFNKTIRDECIFIYDLPLPDSFRPMINDGEVEAFYCITPAEIKEALLDGEKFKPNSGLVTLHFLLRKKLVQFSEKEAQYLHQRLSLSLV